MHGMGSIVSAGKESTSEEVYPTETVALQAKLRQAALSLNPHLIWSLAHSEAFGEDGHEGDPNWYPAGVSPWYRDHEGSVVSRETPSLPKNASDWIHHLNLNKCDLHKAVILIQKFFRGHQTRKELHTRQRSATKIQRKFRSWKKNGPTNVYSLPSVGQTDNKAPLTGRVFSAHIPSQIRTKSDTERVLLERDKNTETSKWHQQLSLPISKKKENSEKPSQSPSASDSAIGSQPGMDQGPQLVFNEVVTKSVSSKPPVPATRPVPTNINDSYIRQHVFSPALLVSPQVRTGYSPSNIRPPSFHASQGSTKKGRPTAMLEAGAHLPNHHHTQNPQHTEGDKDTVHLAMAPTKPLKQRTRTNNYINPNNGIKSTCMTLQNFDQRWIKPPVESKQQKKVVEPSKSDKKKDSEPEPSIGFSSTEDKRLQFVTPQSEVKDLICNINLLLKLKHSLELQNLEACDIRKQSVDSMLNLLSKGMGKPLPHVPSNIKKEESQMEITTELVHTVQNVIKKQFTSFEPKDFADGSILIKPSDAETLLRAAEFRNDVVHKLKHLTPSIRLDYYQLMNDIERTQFYAAQQMEAGLPDYQPLKLVLISSTIPKAELLALAVREGVLAHIYDFSESLNELLIAVQRILTEVQPGAKVKHIAIVCKGGPGYFYLVKRTPVTPAKLRSNQPLLEFWRGLGKCMSKLIPGQTTLHLMESNMAGNKQGEKLLTDLESVLYAHQVTVSSPLELAPKGREMINLFFEPAKHKFWKNKRYTKLRLY